MPVETKISFSDACSTDTVRKYSDEYSRKTLSDLLEDEEEGEVTTSLPSEKSRPQRKVSTSSTYSVTSMDALWEKHPRRLSEAGLRRSSDHSVVLTEDTDSFIIGDRVWVGGTKPGQIAYIGETQFAPGDWAGIVLDEPIGKNDGSVAGTRYFQCAEKRGVFSRLTRLTRVPLISPTAHAHDASPASDAGSVFERPPSGAGRVRRALSPNGSIRSAVSSKMNTSMTSTTPTPTGELKLGERVIVSSSRGSKAGTLRFVGTTDFASGVWAGVELDDPLGKNDGSVEGKRYFECAPRFGLFAPIAKVSRSPSNRKPGACAIHSNGRATPLRRSNSRESLTSLGTSVASSRIAVRLGGPGAQELLREKQQHLERLMKERELERAEVAKATMRVDRAETALAYLKKEAAQTTSENEKLRAELDRLNKLLEDEKQKVEDLMFRSEEENINREDHNKYKEQIEKEKAEMEQRLRNLEAECALQAARADTAAGALRALEDHRAAELAALADNHKEEIAAAHSLSSELQKLLDEAYALLKEKENEKDSLNKSMSDELTKLKLESERSLSDAKTKMAIAQTEFDTQLSVLTAKLQLAESKLEAEKQNVERSNKENSQTLLDLNTKLTQLQAIIDDKTHELNRVLSTSKEHELNLNKEIAKLKMELSAKILDLEQLNDANQKHVRECTSLGSEMATLKEQFNNKVNEYENLLNEASQQNEKNINEIVELKQDLSTKVKLYEKLLNEFSASKDSTERLINEYKQTIHERDKEIIKLKNEYEQANANFNIKHSMIAEEHKKEIEDRNLKIEKLLKEIDNHKQTLDKNKIEFDTLNSQLSINIDEIKILSEQNQKLQKYVDELTQINSELKMKISSLELENSELQRQLQSSIENCKELQSAKEKVETEYLNLTGQTTDSSEQFNKLSQHLKDTEKELQELKDKYRETTNNHGKLEQELKQQIFKIQEEFSLERQKLFNTIETNEEKCKLLEAKINEYETQITSMKTKLYEQETSNDIILDKSNILEKEIEALKIKETEIMNEYQSTRQKMEQEIDRYKEEITLLKDEGESSEVKLKEKVDQLIEAQNELNNKLEEARKHEGTLQKIVNDMTQQLANQKSQFDNESIQMQTQISTVTEENMNLKEEKRRLKDLLHEKESCIKELSLELSMFEVDLQSNLDIIAEKEHQIMAINEEFNKLIENKNQLEQKVNLTLSENSQLKQTYDTLFANSNAESSIIKEQQEKLNSLQKDLNDAIQNKIELESKLANTATELEKMISKNEAASKELQDNIDAKSKLEANLLEKEQAIHSQIDKNELESKKLKSLEEELLLLKQNLDAKDKSIEEKDKQISNLNALLQCNANELQQKISEMQSEFLKLSENHKTEVESLNNTINNLKTRAKKHDKLLDEVNQQKQKVGELQILFTKAEDDIKQLTNINNGQRENYEDLNKQLQTQFEEYKKDSKKTKHELKNKLIEFENELKESKNKINDEIMKQTQLQRKLDEAENKVLDLSNKLELLNIQQNSSVEKDDKLEKLTLELQSVRKSNMEILANSEKTIKDLKLGLEKKIKELNLKNETISKLQDDLKIQIAKTEVVEREKVLLQKAVTAKEAVVKDGNDNGLTTEKNDNKQKTPEEQEMLDGQVSFLNSVIVDMQRKNEQLLARLLALEGGNSTPNDEVDVVFNGRSRAVAPRLFCDICEIFDAHDTEDCPRQAAPDPPPALGPRRAPPPPRPYCDICEVFGHSTDACDEEETF